MKRNNSTAYPLSQSWSLAWLLSGHRWAMLFACVIFLGTAGQVAAQGPVLSAPGLFGGGVIDITNGALVITTSSFGFVPTVGYPGDFDQTGTAEYGDAAIHDAVNEGFNAANGGYWNGTNGIISSTAAGDSNKRLAVGYVDNSLTNWSTFDGVPVNANQSIIACTYYGDALLQGTVNSNGLGLVSGLGSNLGIASGPSNTIYGPTGVGWILGDFYNEGYVSIVDRAAVLRNFGASQLPNVVSQVEIGSTGAAQVDYSPQTGELSLVITGSPDVDSFSVFQQSAGSAAQQNNFWHPLADLAQRRVVQQRIPVGQDHCRRRNRRSFAWHV